MNQDTLGTLSVRYLPDNTDIVEIAPRIQNIFNIPQSFSDWDNNLSQELQNQTREDMNNISDEITPLVFDRLINLSVGYYPTEYFNAIQKWEGFVIKVYEETFIARLIPILGSEPEIEAEIYLEEVAPDDRALIEPGAVFYWSIGYLDKPSGRLRASIIRFRRILPWSNDEITHANQKVSELKSLFDE